LRNLHLCMPASRAVFCVEPVSHVPGVVNRRAFAHLGDMTALAPGEALEGTVVLSPERLPHQAA
jgi:aldose 1-epimerase